jgi:protein gp79
MANLERLALGITLLAVSLLLMVNLSRDPFSQRNFPCQEDEVLMFIDTPSHDRTGCVNLEEVN